MKNWAVAILCSLAVVEMVLFGPLVAADCIAHNLEHARSGSTCGDISEPQTAQPAAGACSCGGCGQPAPPPADSPSDHDDDHPQTPCSGCKPGCPACGAAVTLLPPETPSPQLAASLPPCSLHPQPSLGELQEDIFHPPRN